MANILFAGLGVMGAPMAGHLIKAGHKVTGYNRTVSKTDAWANMTGGIAAYTLSEAARECDALILCVGRDDDVVQTVTAAIGDLRPGTLIIDHTTASAKCAREMHALCLKHDIDFYDAPVSGGEAGAINGQLSIMVGGAEARFEEVKTLIAGYTKSITRIGDSGAGQLAKMANQIAIAGVVQGLAEALHFTKCAGIDPALVFNAISQGAAGSWQMSNRWATMTEGKYDFGFAVDWMRKDLGITLEEAASNGARLEVTKLVDKYYSEIQEMGGSRWDTSSLLARLKSPN